jgi:hypothetical protein
VGSTVSRPFVPLDTRLRILDEAQGEVVLEGRCRLQPGRVVSVGHHRGDVRRLLVTEWRVVAADDQGLAYRGKGRLVDLARTQDGCISPCP